MTTVISHEHLRLIVEGQVLLDDINPVSSPGWWDAVDQLGGRCIVVISTIERLTLAGHSAPEVGRQMVALLDTEHAVSALLPVGDDGAPAASPGGATVTP